MSKVKIGVYLILHAVQEKPPSIVTGRVGAVGQIHFICTISDHNQHHIFCTRE